MSKLALLGGKPAVSNPFATYNSIGREEIEAVGKVMQSGCLSKFLGVWGDDFLGGPFVRSFEEAWSAFFGVKHAISMNSATSGLFAAVGAVGAGPGDEIIVPPYTMSATAMAPLIYGAIPVFADIDPVTFCLDPNEVKRNISSKTKAILTVNLFGHPSPLSELRAIADQHGLMLIEDNAQGPLAMENGRFAGTIGHIGVFSLNYHKHIHTGEGGVCVTNDDHLALRLQMIRNHGENAADPAGVSDISNMVGFNYRMTELNAAIGIEQLKKASYHVARREQVAQMFSQGLSGLVGITPPQVRRDCRHVYYVWAMHFAEQELGVSREVFARALMAEGFPVSSGYVKPLYLLPLFQKRIAFGANGWPFSLSDRQYEKGMCPVTERMHDSELLCFLTCAYDLSDSQVHSLIEAFQKVYSLKDELIDFGQRKNVSANALPVQAL